MSSRTHFKRFFVTIALSLVVLLLAGCGGNKEAQAFADKLYIAGSDDVRGSFPLPKYVQGNLETEVTWVSSNEDVVSVAEFPSWDEQYSSDLYVKATVVLQPEEAEVTLTATVKYGGQTATKTILLTVMADEYAPSTVAQAKVASLNTLVRIQGTVIFTISSGYIVQDATGNMYVFGSQHNRSVGDIVVVRGIRKVFNNMPQLDRAVSEKIDQEAAGYNPYATAITGTVKDIIDLPINEATSYTKMYKLEVIVKASADPYNPYHLVNPLNLKEFVGISNYTSAKSLTELATLEEKFVECYVLVYSSYGGAYSVLFAENKAVEKTLTYTDQEKADLALQKIQGDLGGSIVTSDIDFYDELASYDAEVTWTSGNLDIIAADGKVTFPDDNTVVTITVTTKVEEAEATGTFEVTVTKLDVSTIASIIPLTPEKAADPRVLVLVQGEVIGHQYRGYWVADATGAILVWVNVNLTTTNAPAIGTTVQVKGQLTTFGEKNSFVAQIAPISFTVLEDAPAINVIAPVVKTFDELFSYGLTTRPEAQDAAEEIYGKFITITGQLVRMGNDHYWKIQDPTNPDRWFRINSLGNNTDLLALRNDTTPPTITITVIVRDLYFVDDPGTFNDYKAGTIGGVFFANQNAIVPTT